MYGRWTGSSVNVQCFGIIRTSIVETVGNMKKTIRTMKSRIKTENTGKEATNRRHLKRSTLAPPNAPFLLRKPSAGRPTSGRRSLCIHVHQAKSDLLHHRFHNSFANSSPPRAMHGIPDPSKLLGTSTGRTPRARGYFRPVAQAGKGVFSARIPFGRVLQGH